MPSAGLCLSRGLLKLPFSFHGRVFSPFWAPGETLGAAARPGIGKAARLAGPKTALPEMPSGPLGNRAEMVGVLGLAMPITHAPGGVSTCGKKAERGTHGRGAGKGRGKYGGQTSWYVGRTPRGQMRKTSKHPYTPIFLNTYVQSSIKREAGWHDLMDLEMRVHPARHGMGGRRRSESLGERQSPRGRARLGLP